MLFLYERTLAIEQWRDKVLGEEILTDPSPTTLTSSQSGLLPETTLLPSEAAQTAASGPHVDLGCFLHINTQMSVKQNAKAHLSTHTHTLRTTRCYAAVVNKAFNNYVWAILSHTTDLCHSWWQSNNKVSILHWCTPLNSFFIFLLFTQQAYFVGENWKQWITSIQSNSRERDRVL